MLVRVCYITMADPRVHLRVMAGGLQIIFGSASRLRGSRDLSDFLRQQLTTMWKYLTATALFADGILGQSLGSASFLRFGCSQLVVERVDPLVAPGLNPSPHVHQVVGGNSFNVTVSR